MDIEKLEKLYKDFTLQLVLSKNLDDIGLIAITKNQLKQIIKIIKHYNQIQSQLKKQKEIIDKAMEYINENLIISSILDGKKTYCLNNYTFDYKELLDILKEVSE